MPFTREELLKIIPRFIGAIGNIANTDAKVKRLHECGSNEDKVGDAIDDAQKEALKGLGMDPERIVEMKFVYKMFQKDQSIFHLSIRLSFSFFQITFLFLSLCPQMAYKSTW